MLRAEHEEIGLGVAASPRAPSGRPSSTACSSCGGATPELRGREPWSPAPAVTRPPPPFAGSRVSGDQNDQLRISRPLCIESWPRSCSELAGRYCMLRHAMIRYDRPANLTAFEAISEAQKLAFAPIAFQASVALKRLGILEAVEAAKDDGAAAAEIARSSQLPVYGVRVLLDMGLSHRARLAARRSLRARQGRPLRAERRDDARQLGFRGRCLLRRDELAARTPSSNARRRASRASAIGRRCIKGLTRLPEPSRTSWLKFDHFYSSNAFAAALRARLRGQAAAPARHRRQHGPLGHGVRGARPARRSHDRRSTRPSAADERAARRQPARRTHSRDGRRPARRDGHAPGGRRRDLDESVPRLLLGAASDADTPRSRPKPWLPECSLFVLELLCDRQRYDAATYSVNATSLYFTCIANGVSRMYRSEDLLRIIRDGGADGRRRARSPRPRPHAAPVPQAALARRLTPRAARARRSSGCAATDRSCGRSPPSTESPSASAR